MTSINSSQVPVVSRTAESMPGADSHDASLPARRHLPDTRNSITHKFTINGYDGYIIVGLFENEQPGEVFLKMAKQGSTLAGLLNTVGILISVCLQYGVPVHDLARKFEDMRFEPSGWTPNRDIKETSSIVDYIFRWINLTFPAESLAASGGNSSLSDDLSALVRAGEGRASASGEPSNAATETFLD